jgi:multiple antibiotic resistance protein
MLESALLLLLVVDPFGNLPFVLAVTGGAPPARYRRIIIRETVLALLVLVVFALAGDLILGYLQIERAALAVAGGVILFLISLKMIFQSVAQIFHDRYGDDPVLVPIAVPSLAGPSAITTAWRLSSPPCFWSFWLPAPSSYSVGASAPTWASVACGRWKNSWDCCSTWWRST